MAHYIVAVEVAAKDAAAAREFVREAVCSEAAQEFGEAVEVGLPRRLPTAEHGDGVGERAE
jgi:hypothetical protein